MNLPWIIATVILALRILLFYFIVIKPKQYAKNKDKEAAKERDEIDSLFEEAEYKVFLNGRTGFVDKQMMELLN